MSVAQFEPPERRLNPNLTVNLSSNNPFRRASNSPSLPSPTPNTERPQSRNPFLDQPSDMNADARQMTTGFPMPMPMPMPMSMPRRAPPPPTSQPETMLVDLSLDDRHVTGSGKPRFDPRGPLNGALPENSPPRSGNRPSRSRDEGPRHSGRAPVRPAQARDIVAEPGRRSPGRRARRNSESSIADRKPLHPDDEKRRKERRHRERDGGAEKDGKGRPTTSSRGPKKPSHRLDAIDKLDVTSIFGMGVFHHDGPFDALDPRRNRKGSSRAPMHAFPKDSVNMVLGGSGPVNKNIDLAQFHGQGEDSFADYNTGTVKAPAAQAVDPYAGSSFPRADSRPAVDGTSSFNPSSKIEPVHGPETLGLGTSTFLEGAPAARSAMRRESEDDGPGPGLGRKMSLAKKIRGIGNARPGSSRFGQAVSSPESRYEHGYGSPGATQSAGGISKVNEKNPFFEDYDRAYDRKAAGIRAAEEKKWAEGASPGKSMGSALQRSLTGDSMAARQRSGSLASIGGGGGGDGEGRTGGGFLSRVKSLRGGGRGKARPQRDES